MGSTIFIKFFRQETGEVVEFTRYPYLASDEKELDFLKKFSEIFIIMLLPRGYAIAPLSDLLGEIIAYKGKINVCYQDNQKLINFCFQFFTTQSKS